jgi:hypothetical protein
VVCVDDGIEVLGTMMVDVVVLYHSRERWSAVLVS